jgi:sugar/nucleoside kinase (ribokinase family)
MLCEINCARPFPGVAHWRVVPIAAAVHTISDLESIYRWLVVGTIGAGDAPFCAFLQFHARGLGPFQALRRAMVLASLKRGKKGRRGGPSDPR